jgi:hypothetical protein
VHGCQSPHFNTKNNKNVKNILENYNNVNLLFDNSLLLMSITAVITRRYAKKDP